MPGMNDSEFMRIRQDYVALGLQTDETKNKELADEMASVKDWEKKGHKEELRITLYNAYSSIFGSFAFSVVIMMFYIMRHGEGMPLTEFILITFCINTGLTWAGNVIKLARLYFVYKRMK